MAVPQITLYVHPLCPYAQRALYASAYKGFPLTIEHVSLENKAAWFLELNPFGKVPTVKVLHRGRQVNLYESLQVAEYFDTLPGPSLYPLQADGQRCPLTKALIDLHIKANIDPVTYSLFPFYFREPSDDEVAKAKAGMRLLNDKYLPSGHFILNSVIGQDVLTMADVMTFPFVERVVVMKDSYFKRLVEGEDFRKVFAWFDRLADMPWARKHRANPVHLRNLISVARTPAYKGLALPLSRYD
jgi:glutathione S-transferase